MRVELRVIREWMKGKRVRRDEGMWIRIRRRNNRRVRIKEEDKRRRIRG